MVQEELDRCSWTRVTMVDIRAELGGANSRGLVAGIWVWLSNVRYQAVLQVCMDDQDHAAVRDDGVDQHSLES